MTEQAPRLIEVDFPLRRVSEDSVREKSIRHGHISTLHIWWARRPLAASRATALAALMPDNPAHREELIRLVAEVSPWEVANHSGAQPHPALQKARKLIREAFGGCRPKVLDCFAGGGAIPLEAMRLGCETYALDYNPVAVLILKAALEYPAKFGQPRPAKDNPGSFGLQLAAPLEAERIANPLLEAVQRWGEWVLEEARKELEPFYPKDRDGSVPVGYLWARTVACQNPNCGAEIPLVRQTWLAKKDSKNVALKLIPDRATRRVEFAVVEGESIGFDPRDATVAGAHARCLLCGGTIDDETIRRLFSEGRAQQRIIAAVFHRPGRSGKAYALPGERDLTAFDEAKAALVHKRNLLWSEWGIDPLPTEQIPTTELRRVAVPLYGLTQWTDLFNPRQKLALITFVEKVRRAYQRMVEEGNEEEFAKAVATYLAIAVDRLSDYDSCLSTWVADGEFVGHTFTRQAIPWVWDYFELNPLSGATGDWRSALGWVTGVLGHCSRNRGMSPASVNHGSATDLPWPDGFFDAVLTDPPYYDNVPYAHLADFFYVWLKRTVGELYPDLFATPLTPKSLEIVEDRPHRLGTGEKDKAFFERMLTTAFREIHRVLRPSGVALIVFAHTTTAAWEAIMSALLGADLYMTASWPIHTERTGRLNAQETASLASSIYMVCRKRTSTEIGEYPKVRREIDVRVRQKLDQFWAEGIRGADFFMSAIGPAVEAFGKYARVEKLSGEKVEVAELLAYVRQVVSEFALQRILQSAELDGVDLATRFYLLYRWTYNHARVHFDEARKLAQGVGVELTSLWGPAGLMEKQQDYVRVPSPLERARDERFSRKVHFTSMVDALQYASWLWNENQGQRLKDHLAMTYGGNEAFWQVAQAIAEVLPDGDKERQVLQGLLYGRRGYADTGRQERLL